MLPPMVRLALDPFRRGLAPVARLLGEADVLQVRHALLEAGLGVADGLIVDGRSQFLQTEGEEVPGPQLADAFAIFLGHKALDRAMQALFDIRRELDVHGDRRSLSVFIGVHRWLVFFFFWGRWIGGSLWLG